MSENFYLILIRTWIRIKYGLWVICEKISCFSGLTHLLHVFRALTVISFIVSCLWQRQRLVRMHWSSCMFHERIKLQVTTISERSWRCLASSSSRTSPSLSTSFHSCSLEDWWRYGSNPSWSLVEPWYIRHHWWYSLLSVCLYSLEALSLIFTLEGSSVFARILQNVEWWFCAL